MKYYSADVSTVTKMRKKVSANKLPRREGERDIMFDVRQLEL